MRPFYPALFVAICMGFAAPAAAQTVAERMQAAAADYRREDWAAARVKFTDLIQESPGAPETKAAWFYLGETEHQLGQFAAAKSAYQNFLLLAGEHPHRELARFRLVEVAYLTGSSDAVTLCEGFLKAHSKSIWRQEALAYLGHLRLIRNEPDLAERVFATAIEESAQAPAHPRIQLGYATALIRMGKSETARPLLADLASVSQGAFGSRAKLLLALLDFESGKKLEARNQLEAILSSSELASAERAEVHVWLGRIIAEKVKSEEAISHYTRALESGLVEPWLSVALYEWTALRIQSKDPAKGLEELRQWKLNPEVLKLDRATRELVAALEVRLSFEAAQYPEAEKLIEQYQSSYPLGANYRQVLEVAGRTAFARGKFEQGLNHFKELLEHPSNSPDEEASYTCQLATLLLARKEYHAAKQELSRVIEPLPQVGSRIQLQRLMAAAEAASGNPKDAQLILEKLLDDPEVSSKLQRRPILRELIELGIRQESFDSVRDRWHEFLAADELNEADLPLVREVGDFAFRQRDWALATNCYRELARKEWELSLQAAGWSGLAWTSLAEGRTGPAREAFENLLELPVPEELKAQAYLPLASLLEQDSENAEAIAMYQRAMTQADDPGVVALAKFKCALRMQQYGGAAVTLEARDMLAELERSQSSSVPLDQVIYRLAWIDSDAGDEAEAERRYSRILNEFPESKLWPDVAYRLARIRLNRNEIDSAAELLEPIELSSLPVELRERLSFLKAQLFAKQGKWPETLLDMGKLAEETQDLELQATATYWQAEAYFQTGQWGEANRLFDRVLATHKQNLEPEVRRQAALRKAESLLASDDWSGALLATEQARTRQAEDAVPRTWPEIDLLAGRALFAGGRLQDAVAAFERAITSSAGETETAAQAQWRIGETWLVQERYTEALEAYLLTMNRYSSPHWRAAALLQAGKCHERLGNSSQALKLYRQLEQEYPSSEFAAQAKRRIEAVERRARADELIRR
jgi:tetratricopeptide (TPR) repeat protein